MTDLHQFQRYASGENVVTNNTMLLLRRIYLHSQVRFRQLILSIWADGFEAPHFGLRFTQQERGKVSVPDGAMAQESVKFVIETKLGPEFDEDQVRRHLHELKNYVHRFALLLGTGDIDHNSEVLLRLRVEAASAGVALAAITFEQLVAKVRQLYAAHHEDMVEMAADYEAFCDSFDLLPQDAWTVFVPPCGQSFAHNISEMLYYCPADRAIRRTRYLGIYAEKAVSAIGTISRIVDRPLIDVASRTVTPSDGPALSRAEQDRILRACEAANDMGWPIDDAHKFFLCDAMERTALAKRSPGGIQNRRYLHLKSLLGNSVPSELPALAQALRTVQWD